MPALNTQSNIINLICFVFFSFFNSCFSCDLRPHDSSDAGDDRGALNYLPGAYRMSAMLVLLPNIFTSCDS